MAVSWVCCAEQDHALIATDTAFLRNSHYHRPSDRSNLIRMIFSTHH